MGKDLHYCHYILSKCEVDCTSEATPKKCYHSIQDILSEYESSSCYDERHFISNYHLCRELQYLLHDDTAFSFLTMYDSQANQLQKKCITQIDEIDKNDIDEEELTHISTICANTLWLLADGHTTESMPKKDGRSLFGQPMVEAHHNVIYLTKMRDNIEKTKNDLAHMKGALNLSGGEKIFCHFIDILGHHAVTSVPEGYYTINYTYNELKEQINVCENLIEAKQTLYYAFLATNVWYTNLWRK